MKHGSRYPDNSSPAAKTHQEDSRTKAYAGPTAHRLARELGVALEQVSGSAENGRITATDIKNFVRGKLLKLDGQGTPAIMSPSKTAEKILSQKKIKELQVDITGLEALRRQSIETGAAEIDLSLERLLLKGLTQVTHHAPLLSHDSGVTILTIFLNNAHNISLSTGSDSDPAGHSTHTQQKQASLFVRSELLSGSASSAAPETIQHSATLTFEFDQESISPQQAESFLRQIKKHLENPFLIALQ